jgi:hypothetical protein
MSEIKNGKHENFEAYSSNQFGWESSPAYAKRKCTDFSKNDFLGFRSCSTSQVKSSIICQYRYNIIKKDMQIIYSRF